MGSNNVLQSIGNRPEPIAVVGMSGIFPEASNVDEFWQNIKSGKDCVTVAPDDRGWSIDEYFDPTPQTPGKTYARQGGFLKNIDKFDPLFFELPPKDAEKMDPSARLFLQEAWRAIEDSGHAPKSLDGARVGMFYCAKDDYSNVVHARDGTFISMTDTFVPSILAYHLNFVGPAVSVDTACSSTLSAISYACDALNIGNCDVAVAGGGAVNCTPHSLVMLSQMLFFSPDGRCHTFDARANGTVIGEAIGAVVLKRLSSARRDGDNIHALIKGWGTNQDGRTNGITAPSAKSQAQLQQDIYRRFDIDPAEITMVEAHGTGTKLGDPIEVRALDASFRSFTDKRDYCAIGSVKSNIGHAFFGAGVTSVIKVLQAMRHGQIPPTLNFETPNPAIPFEGSPFYVNTRLRPWQPDNGSMRCAAINAIGATGVNAHLVLEEYQPDPVASPCAKVVTGDGLCAFVLSAKSDDRLRDHAAKLADWLVGATTDTAFDLADVAHTLQVGRDAMSHRLGFVANRTEEAVGALRGFAEQRTDQGGCPVHFGTLSAGAASQRKIAEGMRVELTDAVARNDKATIVKMWTLGADVDWTRLPQAKVRGFAKRISLPTYPFANERYWAEPEAGAAAGPGQGDPLHPLLHENVSNVGELCFSSTFSGEEFFLRDHRIKAQKMLPGVAYLELARAAGEKAVGTSGDTSVRLENVVWMQPFVLTSTNNTLRVAIAPCEAGAADRKHSRLEFEVYGGEQDAQDVVPYCQGDIVSNDTGNRQPPAVDLAAIQDRCNRSTIPGQELYRQLRDIGFMLGPAHQGVCELRIGQQEALGRIALPASAKGEFILHPSMLDSALHCAAGLAPGGEAKDFDLALPFALDALEIYGRSPAAAWAWVRYSKGSAPGDNLIRMDIDLIDENGQVVVHLKHFASRPLTKRLPGEPDPDPKANKDASTFFLHSVWREKPRAEVEEDPGHSQMPPARRVILCGDVVDETMVHAVSQGDNVFDVTTIAADNDVSKAENYERATLAVFGVLQPALKQLADKSNRQMTQVVQLVFLPGACNHNFDGVAALLKTATKENARLVGQIVHVDDDLPAEQLSNRLAEEAHAVRDHEIKFATGSRWAAYNEIAATVPTTDERSRSLEETPWRQSGVYLITGGAGGLGLLLAREILQRCDNPTLILAGRSRLDASKTALFEQLRRLGGVVDYHVVDVVDRKAVDAMRNDVLDRYGRLDGIVHAAGVLADSYIFNKDLADVPRVLAPKVQGLLNLDEAFAATALDFFVAYSSMASEFGNPGQSDYAAANAFMDSYMRYRHQRQARGTRSGQSVAINWPLWRDGGMSVDAAYEEMMARIDGIVPLETHSGLNAFYRALADDNPQAIVLHGDKRTLNIHSRPVIHRQPDANSGDPASGAPAQDLKRRLIAFIRTEISQLIRIDEDRIDADAEFSTYGLDSISLTQLSNALNQSLELKLSPTVFFEFPALGDFAEHLAGQYSQTLVTALKIRGAASTGTPSSGPAAIPPGSKKRPRRFKGGFHRDDGAEHRVAQTVQQSTEPVAVVGMSAQFPMANDVHQLWRNLSEGKDCITVVPKNRWNWQEIYGDPLESPGKTNIKWGGFIDRIGDFDPGFFSITPREAEMMDPQQRLLMLHVWKALENAGYAASTLAGGDTALYIATHDSGYYELFAEAGLATNGAEIPTSLAPNRMSFFLDLHGASEPIETACSSSLIAIHRGVTALRTGTTGMAVVGGVETIPTPTKHINFSRAGLLSEDGRCKTFSRHANGYVRSEGVGMLVLKRLSDARRDGDFIHCLILATAENHGGRANSLTSPNPRAQAQVIQAAYRQAGVDPRSIGYIEAHGTGTVLGDPIEIDGLKAAFRQLYADPACARTIALPDGAPHCSVGSIKSNIGHAELAAGVAGVLKVLLQLRQKSIVRTLHCDEINPHIDLADSPFELALSARPWKAPVNTDGEQVPRRGGISSFGAGGVNAHVVLEEFAAL